MLFPAVASTLLLAAGLFQSAAAHIIQLPAHGRECFHENLRRDDKMTVTYQVGDREFGSSGNLDIDFWIQNPKGQYVTNQKSVSNGDFTFTARSDGKYTYCFGNEHWGANSKEVHFNVHGVVYVNEGDLPADPLEKEVRQMAELLAQVKDEQFYIVARERTHRNTAESTNARVKWWNVFVIGLVVGEGVFQVWWLRRFFEVKRVV
ncbi:endosomal protein P24B [Sodiomyces alkalinus F11]|uniref:Endosomal protein P24B n=1 Tax=Sodiomyces alkalinus (strain CBS 110278 / VKM F-3762 / F11) TaxID=1314773 RepID=A0A3N2PSB1_SODAK|nr:endosomal protein P24B [Sodiomyces alkalinus F11]ROT37360.1 endosomal protein P24B [Sodiomyces alkalinus F11]